jgi:ectoine hydroxylase-related dioxygenase (phytanoyl-CoA dioxygenase family)
VQYTDILAESLMPSQHVFQFSQAQRRQYAEEGYVFLEQALGNDELSILRAECDLLVKEQEREMDRIGSDVLNLSRRNSRYFVFRASKDRPQLGRFIFSDRMAEICRATVGENAMLFWEQFVVKGTDPKGAEFGWHQDSGYVDHPHRPYVNAWIPLDDVGEENGTIYVLPYERAGTREKVVHRPVPNSNDRVGYFGSDPGIPFVAPAGSIAVFSSVTFHRSGVNSTARMRRAYAIQFSPETIYEPDGSLKGLAEPFLENGVRQR